MRRSRLETCESALERFAALLFGKKFQVFCSFSSAKFSLGFAVRGVFLVYFDISNAIKIVIFPYFHLKVAIYMCRSRLETCESALERLAALVIGEKISRFLRLFFRQNFPLFCGKERCLGFP